MVTNDADDRRNREETVDIHVSIQEQAALLECLERQHVRPDCGQGFTALETAASTYPFGYLQRLSDVRSVFEHIIYEKFKYNLGRDVIAVLADETLKVQCIVIDERGQFRTEENHQTKLLSLVPGLRLDERHFGLQAFAFAQLKKRLQAIWGPEHSCQAWKNYWSLAAPVIVARSMETKGVIGYVGILIDRRLDPEGYAMWLHELAHLISKTLESKLHWAERFRFVGPHVAVCIPEHLKRDLTVREIEIIEFLLAGFSLNKICKQIHLSKSTVRTYIQRIAEKWGVKNNIQTLIEHVERVEQEQQTHGRAER